MNDYDDMTFKNEDIYDNDDLFGVLKRAEEDIDNGKVSLVEDTFKNLRKELLKY